MFPSYGSKAGRRYRYYVCLRAQQRGWKHCPNKSVNAAQIEDGILAQLRAMAAGTSHTGPLEKRLSGFQTHQSRRVQRELIRAVVERVAYDRANASVKLRLQAEFGAGEVEFKLVRCGPGQRLPRITRLMALAIRFDDLLRSGVVNDYADLGRLGFVSCARVTQVMSLLNLAPEIQEEILFFQTIVDGREPVSERALRKLTAVTPWSAQIKRWRQLLARVCGK